MKYIIRPTNGDDPRELEAAKAEYDKTTGASCFYNEAGDLIARELNVSFSPKGDE